MALTSKERVAKHRAKVKENAGQRELYLKKERERDRKRRCEVKAKMSGKSPLAQALLKQKREDQKQRQRTRRRKIKENVNKATVMLTPVSASVYKCPQTKGKAKMRVRRSLPQSPRKRLLIATEILREEMPSAAKFLNKIKPEDMPETSRKLDADIQLKVEQFYELDCISRQEPGRRDVISIKDSESNKRVRVQKRIMMMTIKEAYFLFIEQNPSAQIKLAKFFALRPKHVLPISNMPHNVCVCKLHANMEYLIKSVNNAVPDFPNNGSELINAIVCDCKNELCMTSACDNCDDDGKCLKSLIEDADPQRMISWKLWTDVVGRPQVATKEGNIHQALGEIQKVITSYKLHVFVKRIQSSQFEESKANLEEGVAVLQIDFAENFSTTAQDEIQSAHWCHGQVTIFTAVAWLAGSKKRCFAIVSDDLLHGKLSVYVFLKAIVKELKEEFPELKKVKIFSDGCAAQFKNKFTLSNLVHMEEDFNGVAGEWSFFASSHGKGAVDGVGGTVKRNVWLQVKARQLIINTAEEFAECARKAVKNVHILYITAEDVAAEQEFLMKRWENVQAIPRLQSVHHITPGSRNGTLSISLTSNSTPKTCVVFQTDDATDDDGVEQIDWNDNDSNTGYGLSNGNLMDIVTTVDSTLDIGPGAFVRVGLPVVGKSRVTRQYYAEVTEIDLKNDVVFLKYMASSGKNFWVWPDTTEESCETISMILLQKVDPPTLVNNRGQFRFGQNTE